MFGTATSKVLKLSLSRFKRARLALYEMRLPFQERKGAFKVYFLFLLVLFSWLPRSYEGRRSQLTLEKTSKSGWSIRTGEQRNDLSTELLHQLVVYKTLLINHDRRDEDPKRQRRDLRRGMKQSTSIDDFNLQVQEIQKKLILLDSFLSLFQAKKKSLTKFHRFKVKAESFSRRQSIEFAKKIEKMNLFITTLLLEVLTEFDGPALSIDTSSRYYALLATALNPEVTLPSFVPIPTGHFIKGTDESEELRDSDEIREKVFINTSFEISATEVTQLQWYLVMGYNPSYFSDKKYCKDHIRKNSFDAICPHHPVEQVSFYEALLFIARLNQNLATSGWQYRLPSENDWEYAGRAGTTSLYSFGSTWKNIDQFAWHFLNSGQQTHPVALKKPNPWGLYDMHGNVWEWTRSNYSFSDTDIASNLMIWKGGGFMYCERRSRPAYKLFGPKNLRSHSVGFRLIRTSNLP